MSVALKHRIARFNFFLFRGKTLSRTTRLFADIPSPFPAEFNLFGFRCCLDLSRGVTHQLLYLEGERFIKERFLIKRLLRPGMWVVDVGANATIC